MHRLLSLHLVEDSGVSFLTETCHQRPNIGMDIQKAPHIRRIKLSLLIFVNIVCKISICMYREINSSIASTDICTMLSVNERPSCRPQYLQNVRPLTPVQPALQDMRRLLFFSLSICGLPRTVVLFRWRNCSAFLLFA